MTDREKQETKALIVGLVILLGYLALYHAFQLMFLTQAPPTVIIKPNIEVTRTEFSDNYDKIYVNLRQTRIAITKVSDYYIMFPNNNRTGIPYAYLPSNSTLIINISRKLWLELYRLGEPQPRLYLTCSAQVTSGNLSLKIPIDYFWKYLKVVKGSNEFKIINQDPIPIPITYTVRYGDSHTEITNTTIPPLSSIPIPVAGNNAHLTLHYRFMNRVEVTVNESLP